MTNFDNIFSEMLSKKNKIENLYSKNNKYLDERKELYKKLKSKEKKSGIAALVEIIEIQKRTNEIQEIINENNILVNELKFEIMELDLIENAIADFKQVEIKHDRLEKEYEKMRREKSEIENDKDIKKNNIEKER